MKRFCVNLRDACVRLCMTLLRSETLLVLIGCFLLSVLLGAPSARCADTLKQELSLIQHTGHTIQPLWQKDGAFSDLLQQNVKHCTINYLAKQTNFVLNDTLNDLKKKINVTFSPGVMLKPFIIVEELQDYLVAYRSKKQRKNIHIDENFEAKIPLQPFKLSQLKKIVSPKAFSVSPYYNKIYGLHLHISW